MTAFWGRYQPVAKCATGFASDFAARILQRFSTGRASGTPVAGSFRGRISGRNAGLYALSLLKSNLIIIFPIAVMESRMDGYRRMKRSRQKLPVQQRSRLIDSAAKSWLPGLLNDPSQFSIRLIGSVRILQHLRVIKQQRGIRLFELKRLRPGHVREFDLLRLRQTFS